MKQEKINCCVIIYGCQAYPLTACKGYSSSRPEVAGCRWMGGYQRCKNPDMIAEKKEAGK